jgi:hypothetical protein
MSSGFRVCEQYGNEGDDEHDDKDEIVFPCNTCKRDRIDKDIEEERNIGGSENNSKATGSKRKGPDLSRIRDQKRSKGDIIAGEKNEKEWNHLSGLVISTEIPRDMGCTHCSTDSFNTVLRKGSRKRRDDDVSNQHYGSGTEKELLATNPIYQERGPDGHDQVPKV